MCCLKCRRAVGCCICCLLCMCSPVNMCRDNTEKLLAFSGILVMLCSICLMICGALSMAWCNLYTYHVNIGIPAGGMLLLGSILTIFTGYCPRKCMLCNVAILNGFHAVLSLVTACSSGAIGVYCDSVGQKQGSRPSDACYNMFAKYILPKCSKTKLADVTNGLHMHIVFLCASLALVLLCSFISWRSRRAVKRLQHMYQDAYDANQMIKGKMPVHHIDQNQTKQKEKIDQEPMSLKEEKSLTHEPPTAEDSPEHQTHSEIQLSKFPPVHLIDNQPQAERNDYSDTYRASPGSDQDDDDEEGSKKDENNTGYHRQYPYYSPTPYPPTYY